VVIVVIDIVLIFVLTIVRCRTSMQFSLRYLEYCTDKMWK